MRHCWMTFLLRVCVGYINDLEQVIYLLQRSRIEENPKTHYNGIEKQAAWSICCTHNADSRQFPTDLPRFVPVGQG